VRGAGGDKPIHHSVLVDVQDSLGVVGRLVLAALIRPLADRRRRLAARVLVVAVLIWSTWIVFWYATSGGPEV
jgi:hypothetical protein